MWADLAPVGRRPGDRRLPPLRLDRHRRRRCGEWFRGEAERRGLDVVQRPGRQPLGLERRTRTPTGPGWSSAATWTPCRTAAPSTGRSASCRRSPRWTCCAPRGFAPGRPLGIACFADEEGARFGVACAGSRLLTGALDPDRARGADRRRRHDDGRGDGGRRARRRRARAATTRRCAGSAPSSSCTSSRAAALVDVGAAVGVAIVDLAARPLAAGPARPGRPRRHHPAGRPATTRCWRWPPRCWRPGRRPSGTARWPRSARCACARTASTRSRRRSPPGSTPAAPDEADVRAVVAERRRRRRGTAARVEESWTAADRVRRRRCATGSAAVLGTTRPGAGAADRRRARRRHPVGGRRPDGDAVRPQPDRGLALPRRARRARRLPRRRRRPRPRRSRSWRDDAYWCEHAWLDRRRRSRAACGSSVERRADHRRRRPASTRRPATTGCPASCCPGFANAHSHAFHRALRGRTHDGGGTFWTWRERMYAVAGRLDPDSYLRWPGRPTPRWRWPGSPASASSTTCTTRPAAAATPTRTRWAEALIQAAADAGIRLTLLDTCYLAGGLEGTGHLPLDDVQRRFSDGDADAWADAGRSCLRRPAGRADRRRGALGARRAGRRSCRPSSRPPPAGRCTSTSPSSPPRTRPARPSTAARPTAAARRARRARPGHDRRARHPPHRRRHRRCSAPPARPSAPAPARRPTSPTASGPFRRLAGRRLAALPGQRPARDDRPARRGPRCWRRTSGWSPASAAGSARPSWSTRSPRPATARSAGPTPGGSPSGSAPTWSPSASTPPAPPAAPPASWSWPPRPPTCTPSWSTAGSWSPTEQHVLGDVGRLLAEAIAPLWEDA